MQLRIMTEPQQGADYGRQLAVARATEQLGFDAFFRSDHYLNIGDGDGLPGPTDAWLTLAGLAMQTSRIKLGTLVSPITFRYPGPLAISVAQVDEMSGGRVELGIGSGWFQAEHAAYGIPFPDTAERFDRLEEQLAVITGLWDTPIGERFSFAGKFYPVTDSPGLPKPVQRPHPPIVIGGSGPAADPAARRPVRRRVQRAVRQHRGHRGPRSAGSARPARQPAGTRAPWSTRPRRPFAADGTRPSWPAARRRSAGIWPTQRADGLVGTPDEIVDRIGTFAGLGATRIYLQVLDLHDLDHLELIASEVMPQVR